MSEPSDIENVVSKWFEEDEKLLSDVHNARDIILIIEKLGKEEKSITKNIVKESHLKESAVYKKLRKLLEDDLVSCRRGGEYEDPERGGKVLDGRIRYWDLTEKGQKVADYFKLFSLPEPPLRKGELSVSSQPMAYAREFHSARLRDLTRRILEQLPEVHATDIYSPSIVRPKQIYDGLQLSIEEDVLFSHLKKHKEFVEFVEFFKEFKMLCEEFKQKKDEALEGIEKDVSKHFNLEYSPQWKKADSFSRRMTKWIFDGGIHSLEERREKFFEPYYVDIKSRLEEEKRGNQDLLQYWVGGTGFVQTRKGNRQKEAFQKEIDDKLSDYMRRIEKAPYYSDIRAAQRLLERARDMGKRIDLILRRNLEIAVFSDCEYTTAMD